MFSSTVIFLSGQSGADKFLRPASLDFIRRGRVLLFFASDGR